MCLKNYLIFLAWVRAMSEDMAVKAKPAGSFCLELCPAILGNEIDLIVSAILSEVKAAFWKELRLNPEHEMAKLKVRVDIKSRDYYRGYILSSPPSPADGDTLDDRFFKATSSFAKLLRGDLCWYIINSTNYKSQMVGSNPTNFPKPTNHERRCSSL